MSIDYDQELAQLMKSRYPGNYCDAVSLPKPYVGDGPIKTIVIGADPTYLKDNGKFEFVFGLENTDSKFFRGILINLDQVGLSLDNVYVQNLIKPYFKKETSKNPDWEECALLWLENLKREIDDRFDRTIPVLVTAHKILKLIVYREHLRGISPKMIYSKPMVFEPRTNFFGRNVLAMFRHYTYQLGKWENYRDYIKGILTV